MEVESCYSIVGVSTQCAHESSIHSLKLAIAVFAPQGVQYTLKSCTSGFMGAHLVVTLTEREETHSDS